MKNFNGKNRITLIILIVILLAGLSLVLYPFIADFWNSRHQSEAIASYVDSVQELDEDLYEEILEEARQYNSLFS